LAVIGSETPPQMSDGDRVLWVRIADCCPADAPVPKYSDPSMANPGQPTQPAVDRTSRRFDEMREVGDGHAGGRRESYTATKRNRIGNWAEAGDLRVRIGPEILLDSVTYASQSPDYYLIVKSVSIRNDGRYSLNLEEVRLGSCAPHLVVGGDLHPITPPQPEFMNRCGIMDLLRRQGISYGDIEPGQNVQLAPGHTITLAFVYSLSSPMLAEGEVSFRFWAVEVLEDGDARDYGGSTFILGARTR